MRHVYFWALPIGEKFVHKGEVYQKIEDEYVLDQQGKRWVFEPHYGCVITEEQFTELGLTNEAIRPL